MDGKEASIFKAIEQLRTLSHLYMKKRRDLAKSVELTEAQWRVLEEIVSEDFMPSLFASKQDLSKAAISKILKQLINTGHISVTASPDDGRYRHYTLTKKAEAKLNQLNQMRKEAIEKIWKPTDSALLDASIQFNDQLIARFLDEQKN